MKLNKIRFLYTKGTNREIGRAIGKKQRKEIKQVLSKLKNDNKLFVLAKKMLQRHRKVFPGFVEELEGMAEGAGVDFLKLFAFNCFEYNLYKFSEHKEKCTTIFWQGKSGRFVGHNEDGDAIHQDKILLVNAAVNNKCSFLTLNYPGLLCGDTVSVNSHRIVHAVNTLYPEKKFKEGFVRSFIGRALLESPSIEYSNKILSSYPNFEGLHVLIYSGKERRGIAVETIGPENFKINLDKNFYIHSNHYIFPPFKNGPQKISASSLNRIKKGIYLLNHSGELNLEKIKSILSDHRGFPLNICRHQNGDMSMTLASGIVDINNWSVYAANGNPCQNKYFKIKYHI